MIILIWFLALIADWLVLFFAVAPKEMTNFLQRDPAARNYFEVMLLLSRFARRCKPQVCTFFL